MRFFAPTDVYVEKNCVKNHKEKLLSLGTKAFIITGRHSSAVNGSLSDVTEILSEAGIPYDIFTEIEENPSVETVAKASEIGKAVKADFVIGIGGGSPLDAAKAIALLMANPEETSDCLYTAKNLKALPIAAIPTTCGTGSEVTPNAVLTRHEFKTKKSISYQLYPDLALVDGKYLKYAGQNLILNTAADALAHCVESRLHTKANIYNHMFSEYGLKLWASLKPYIKKEKELDEKAYETLMLASTVAGMAIAQTSTSLPHALSYDITYNYGVPHGKACGTFLAAYMKTYACHKTEDVNHVLSLLEFTSVDEFGAFLRETLGEITIKRTDLDIYTQNMLQNPGKLATYPFNLTENEVRRILEESLNLQ